jgi:hypothetical protein
MLIYKILIQLLVLRSVLICRVYGDTILKYKISLICDKGVTSQNLAFLSYTY